MATVRMQHTLCHGVDVLYDVGGRGFTITFPTAPTQDQIDEWGTILDQRVLDEVAENIVNENEEELI